MKALLKPLSLTLALSSLSLFQSAYAQDEETSVVDKTNAFYFALGRIGIDDEVAFMEGIEDTATYFRFGWEGQSDAWLYGAGLSGYLYSDNEGFSVLVEEEWSNDVSTAGSDANAFNFYAEGGYSHDLSEFAFIDILGGVEMVLISERSVSNCSNCPSEDIDVGSGFFVAPRLRLMAANGFTFAVTYTQYLTGDTESAFAANFGWTY